MIVMPDQDAVIAITAETPNMQEEINLVWKYILPAMQKEKLPKNKKASSTLSKRLAALALPVPARTNSVVDSLIQGRTFTVQNNSKHVQSMSFSFVNDVCTLNLATDTGSYVLQFGNGAWQQGETWRKGPYLVGNAKASYVGLPALKVDGAYEWKDPQTLALTLRYIESPHTEKMTCHFEGESVSVDFENSLDVGGKKVTLKGKRQM